MLKMFTAAPELFQSASVESGVASLQNSFLGPCWGSQYCQIPQCLSAFGLMLRVQLLLTVLSWDLKKGLKAMPHLLLVWALTHILCLASKSTHRSLGQNQPMRKMNSTKTTSVAVKSFVWQRKWLCDGAGEGAAALPWIISHGAGAGAEAPPWSWSVAGCSWDFIS